MQKICNLLDRKNLAPQKKSYINKIIKSKQLVQSNVNEEIKGENMFRIITYSSYSRLSRHKTSELLLIAFKNAMRGKRRVYKKGTFRTFL